MEQWYHALLSQASPPPPISNETPRLGLTTFGKVFSPDDMQNLIDTLNNESDPIPIRWANAMLGRIFLGLCRTAALEAVSYRHARGMHSILTSLHTSLVHYWEDDEEDQENQNAVLLGRHRGQ